MPQLLSVYMVSELSRSGLGMVWEWSTSGLTVVSQWSHSGLSTSPWGGNGMTQQQTRQLQPLCP
eukprot:11433077-Prorocentrum_lima.AAC.1